MRRSPSTVLATALAGTALAVTAAACGGPANRSQSGETPPAVTSPGQGQAQSPAQRSGAAAVRQITIRVSGGRVEPPPGRVDIRQGQQVRLTVTSDRADEIHVHLYDLKRDVPAGGTATLQFTADVAGLAEVELEKAQKQLVQLVIT
jgi:hypothetical protein